MGDAYDILASFAKEARTQKLRDDIASLLNGNQVGAILSALVMLLVEAHIEMNMDEDGDICIPHTNESLTDLLRAIRELHEKSVEEALNDFKKGGSDERPEN